MHIAGLEAQKLFETLDIVTVDKEKISVITAAFKNYCQRKSNITIVCYMFMSYNQGKESIDTYKRELQYRVELYDYGNVERSLSCVTK